MENRFKEDYFEAQTKFRKAVLIVVLAYGFYLTISWMNDMYGLGFITQKLRGGKRRSKYDQQVKTAAADALECTVPGIMAFSSV